MVPKMRIVLVYLGPHIPEYFWDNVGHILEVQEKYSIDIITSGNDLKNAITNERVRYFVYSPTTELDEQLAKLEIDHKFRDGFWRYSLERLFAITQHHRNVPQEKILHFESDILVMPNFPFTLFESLDAIFWPRVDVSRDVASIIFLPSLAKSREFENTMLEILEESKSIDDMMILSHVARAKKVPIGILPSVSSTESSLVNTKSNIQKTEVDAISSGFKIFNGIFDPAGIGIWLTGTDPRNHFGFTKRYDKNERLPNGLYVNPSLGVYEVNQLGHLSLRESDFVTPIYNLHIHSKNRIYFQEDYVEQLRLDVRRSKNGKIDRSLSLGVFGSLLVENLKKGSLLRFLSWLPVIQKIKRLVPTASSDNIAE